MIRLLVAMEREGEALGALPFPPEIIGIGADSVPSIAPDDIIINVGYCGGDGYAPGTIIEPKAVIDAETGEWIDLATHFSNLSSGSIAADCVPALCVTSPTFVTTPLMTGPAVYDMEMAKLARIPCKVLYSLKIVSDNLNEGDCEAFSSDTAWSKVRELLVSAGLIQLSATQR